MLVQFEKTDKKGAVIGWTAAGVGAFFITEWLIHLPLLNVVSQPFPHIWRALLNAGLVYSNWLVKP